MYHHLLELSDVLRDLAKCKEYLNIHFFIKDVSRVMFSNVSIHLFAYSCVCLCVYVRVYLYVVILRTLIT